ncbi:MAG: sn-glycerol-3-phosphate ABC transporter ATP-binding protein UgpC [Eubacteriales bacterium]|nr:sn-glycerol-3-phosphate ABC transporter ATP-binding protein UgpC [Eubacteriales bacterium]
MANVVLKNVQKIYPHGSRENKKEQKKKAKSGAVQEQQKNQPVVTQDGVIAVHDFNLEIADNEFIVLVGPSGCGKSTTLRMIAGLEEITSGELYIDGRLVNDVAPKDRDIAMVFQSYALYPHMTVYKNMAFGLELRKEKPEIIDQKVREAAEILDITHYLDRLPKALSGGQRQRVAIGRAIVRDPKVFLMDEPLSNLDAKLRNQMRAEIIKLRQRIKTTFVYVTHDQTEAMTLGDRIVIMKDGFIMQVGTPQEVFDRPENLFVAAFIGSPQMNFFPAELVLEDGKYLARISGVDFPLGADLQSGLSQKKVQAGPIILGIRPEHLTLCDSATTEPHLKATVEVCEMMGSTLHLHAKVAQNEVVLAVNSVDLPPEHRYGFKPGEEVNFSFNGNLPHLFGPDEQNLIYA